jgi:carboxylesterase
MSESPAPEPFFLAGGPQAALLVHGFTGSPPEMRLIGDYLHARGMTVHAPLLPGHGTDPADLNRRRWTEFAERVDRAYAELQARSEQVVLAGLSMGALLALHHAARDPSVPAAVVTLALRLRNPLSMLLPLLKHFTPFWAKPRAMLMDPEAGGRLWSYPTAPTRAGHELLKLQRQVRRDLPRVTCPLLIVHSTLDDQLHPACPHWVNDRVGSRDKDLLLLHNSGHALTVDREWELVAERTYAFIQARLGPRRQGAE